MGSCQQTQCPSLALRSKILRSGAKPLTMQKLRGGMSPDRPEILRFSSYPEPLQTQKYAPEFLPLLCYASGTEDRGKYALIFDDETKKLILQIQNASALKDNTKHTPSLLYAMTIPTQLRYAFLFFQRTFFIT